MKNNFKRAIASLSAIAVSLTAFSGVNGENMLDLSVSAADNIVINATNFPDEKFCAFVSNEFDSDGDGTLSAAEIEDVTIIRANAEEISDLTGIKYFTNVTTLNCNDNQLQSLDLSGLTSLESLQCEDNMISDINLTGLTNLNSLNCNNNQLQVLDLTGLTSLSRVYASKNKLTSLDISGFTDLNISAANNTYSLGNISCVQKYTFPGNFDESRTSEWKGASYVDGNLTIKALKDDEISYIYDIDGDAGTETLEFTLTYENITHNFVDGFCEDCKCLIEVNETVFPDDAFRAYVSEEIDSDSNGYISDEEIQKTDRIVISESNVSDLTGLNYFTNLDYLNCSSNNLTSLDISKLVNLTTLECSNNQITSLDFSNNLLMESIRANNNKLTAIDVSMLSNLETIYCNYNNLTSFDVSGLENINYSYCKDNTYSLGKIDCVSEFKFPDGVDMNRVSDITGAVYEDGILTVKSNEIVYTYDIDGEDGDSTTQFKFIVDEINHSLVDGVCSVCNSKIEINETLFPDVNFREYVITQFDDDEDGYLSAEELESIDSIYIYDRDISDITGIEYFKNLTSFESTYNSIQEMDFTKNEKLEEIICNVNSEALTSLNITGLKNLKTVNCNNNALTSLDLTGLTNLEILNCSSNSLTSLDLTGLTNLVTLNCSYNSLTSLDLAELTNLITLNCSANSLTSLNVTGLANLESFNCSANNLTSLNLTGLTNLLTFYCSENSLTSLDLAELTNLKSIDCMKNNLAALDISKNTKITYGVYYSNGRSLGEVDCAYDIALLENLDPERIVKINGAEYKDGKLLITDSYVEYEYDIDGENGTKTETFYLTYDSVSHKFEKGICTECGALQVSQEIFPDKAFCSYISTYYDTNEDGVLLKDEILDITSMSVYSKGISKLNGIEHFTNLVSLDCSENSISALDLTGLEKLESLSCFSNSLTELNVSGLVNLIYLDCSGNQITELDVSMLENLTTLNCYGNSLTTLDVSKLVNLTALNCSKNQLTALDVSNLVNLTDLKCLTNKITELDVSKLVNLTVLNCNDNNLTALDVSNLVNLTDLKCSSNKITALDVSKLLKLNILYCANNNLTAIDISSNPVLTTFGCTGNTFSLGDINCSFNISALENVNPDRITGWTGADMAEDGTISVKSSNVSYTYDVDGEYGENIAEFVLTYDSITHTVEDGICTYCKSIEINEDLFPDKNFRNYVITNIDTDNDGLLSEGEIEVATFININQLEISNLKGLEYFKNLETLFCYGNNLTSLDLTGFTKLASVNCASNKLISLNVSGLSELTYLNCSGNSLTELEVSDLSSLTVLDCYNNNLTALNVMNLSKLIEFDCSRNSIEELEFGVAEELTNLDCSSNALTSLDISTLTALEYLYCYSNKLSNLDLTLNPALSYVNCSKNALVLLEVSGLEQLDYLNCSYNELEEINVSSLKNLTSLNCAVNKLENLDVALLSNLTELICSSNALTSLDVSAIVNLASLDCSDNQITELEVSKLVGLTYLDCDSNNLTSLNVGNLLNLSYLSCGSNNLTSIDVTGLSKLEDFYCNFNVYPIELTGAAFDITKLPAGFNIDNVVEWSNVTVVDNIITVIDPNQYVEYSYNVGNNITSCFRLLVTSASLTEDMIIVNENVSYDSYEKTPVEVYFGNVQLIEGKNYSVAYENNINVGTATAVITGQGIFDGEFTVSFTIEKGEPELYPIIEDEELYEGDALPIIRNSIYGTEGTFEWNTDVETLALGENILKWIFTPNDTDNYIIVEGEASVYAVTKPEATTSTSDVIGSTTETSVSGTGTSTNTTTAGSGTTASTKATTAGSGTTASTKATTAGSGTADTTGTNTLTTTNKTTTKTTETGNTTTSSTVGVTTPSITDGTGTSTSTTTVENTTDNTTGTNTSTTTDNTETSTSTTTDTTTTEPSGALLGDANGDGRVNVRDCAFIANALANDKEGELPENADFNGDKKINVRDAAAIARWLANSYTDKDAVETK